MVKRDREWRRDAPSDSESSDGGRSRRRKKHKKTDKRPKKTSHKKKKARHDRDEPSRPDYKVFVCACAKNCTCLSMRQEDASMLLSRVHSIHRCTYVDNLIVGAAM